MKSPRIILLFVLTLSIVLPQLSNPVEIQLPDPENHPDMEYSGLAWYDNYLILLPQYPQGYLPSILRNDLEKFIRGDINTISVVRIPLNGDAFTKSIPGFEGFEALLFQDTTAYFLIEAETRKGQKGFLVKGSISSIKSGIHLDPKSLVELNTPERLNNMAYEAMILYEETILPIYEANGENVNPDPWVPIVSTREMTVNDMIPFPWIEFRITDATALDKNNRFWAINYFWHGDYNLLKPGNDSFKNPFGPVSRKKDLERILEFEFTGDHFFVTQTPPVYLTTPHEPARNWEGIARFDPHGFLLITDKFPRSILMFVPFANH